MNKFLLLLALPFLSQGAEPPFTGAPRELGTLTTFQAVMDLGIREQEKNKNQLPAVDASITVPQAAPQNLCLQNAKGAFNCLLGTSTIVGIWSSITATPIIDVITLVLYASHMNGATSRDIVTPALALSSINAILSPCNLSGEFGFGGITNNKCISRTRTVIKILNTATYIAVPIMIGLLDNNNIYAEAAIMTLIVFNTFAGIGLACNCLCTVCPQLHD